MANNPWKNMFLPLREVIQLTATNELPQTQKDQWEADLEELTDSMSDRHGFIDYEDASEYCDALEEYMNDRLPDLLFAGKTMDAFQLSWLTFRTGVEQDMDDSDGGLHLHCWKKVGRLTRISQDWWQSTVLK